MATSASTPINPPVPVANNTVVLTDDQLLILNGINNIRIKNGENPLSASDPAALVAITKLEAFAAAEAAAPVVPINTETTPTPPVTATVAPPVVPTNTVVLTPAQLETLAIINEARADNGNPPLSPTDPAALTAVVELNKEMSASTTPTPANSAASTDTIVLTPSQQTILDKVNRDRISEGLNPLSASDPLIVAAITEANAAVAEARATPVVPNNTTVTSPTTVQLPEITIPQPAGTDFMIDVTGQTNAAVTKFIDSKLQKTANSKGVKDWRFRMSLAPSANYMYKDRNPGILSPLAATNGVIFPYTPQISIAYTANYTNYDLTHSNFKIHTYKNSSIENVTITGDFTAQDTAEANYLLAVMHFFKTVTKMFYGQDQNPQRGIPPPLLYLSGFGQYQFDMHPVVITSYSHTFPTDVDYISSYPTNNSNAIGGQNMQPYAQQITSWLSPLDRLRQLSSSIQPGGLPPPPKFSSNQNINEATRVPTKVQIQLNCLPVVTRNVISNNFSLKRYATGELMKGSTNGLGGGVW